MPTQDEAYAGFRLLTIEPSGHGRRRLLTASPAHFKRGRWTASEQAADAGRHAPCALQRPDGRVEELGSGLVFDSRSDFLRARGASAG